jgi:hypothetical protein
MYKIPLREKTKQNIQHERNITENKYNSKNLTGSLYSIYLILSRVWVTRDRVWIGKRNNCTLIKLVTTNNNESHRVTHFEDHSNYSTHKTFSLFTSRCLVTVSNGRRSPSSGFPNCLRPPLTSHNCDFQLLSLYNPGTVRRGEASSIIACSLVAGEPTCPQSCPLATAVVLSPVYTAVTWQWVS